jgi:hypothetical protein
MFLTNRTAAADQIPAGRFAFGVPGATGLRHKDPNCNAVPMVEGG